MYTRRVCRFPRRLFTFTAVHHHAKIQRLSTMPAINKTRRCYRLIALSTCHAVLTGAAEEGNMLCACWGLTRWRYSSIEYGLKTTVCWHRALRGGCSGRRKAAQI